MTGDTAGLDPALLEIIVCPQCRGPLEVVGGELACQGECRLVYPVREGIPVLLVDEARRPS
ncbi:Trm112 family protein [Nocardioides dongkuii]|uniref:Trm112 family protein n=1 Tax=Nocardioides dongkuii TaxID=2760089 RepID=UPI0015F9E493|nr:Trm112 family protein [Nocardioides dongkuii]